MDIDYKKLNNRIVEQAKESAKLHFTLSEDQKAQLVENKIKRAQAMIKTRNIVYHQIED
jgi:hypothetical protein